MTDHPPMALEIHDLQCLANTIRAHADLLNDMDRAEVRAAAMLLLEVASVHEREAA